MTIPDKLRSRKFWAALLTGGAMVFTAITGTPISNELISALTLICVTALAAIGVEDTAKAIKNG